MLVETYCLSPGRKHSHPKWFIAAIYSPGLLVAYDERVTETHVLIGLNT